MTSEEIDSLKVAACEDDNQDNFEFVEPLYIDDDFVVVEQKWFAWFLVRKSRAFQFYMTFAIIRLSQNIQIFLSE